jgi:hypothetical protein
MDVAFYTRRLLVEVECYEVDEELAKNVSILCVAYRNCKNGFVAFGAASSDDVCKPTRDLLEKIAIGRLEKSPNYDHVWDLMTSIVTMGYSGKRIKKHQPKSIDDKMHELCSTAIFTRIYEYKGRKVEVRDKFEKAREFADRVTVVKFSLHWANEARFAMIGASVWRYEGCKEDNVDLELLQETADFRFSNCPIKLELPESLHSLDEFIRKAIRKHGCHEKNAKVIFPQKQTIPNMEIIEKKSDSPCRTDDEILQRYKLRKTQSFPEYDEELNLYLQALPFHMAKDYLEIDTDEKNWDNNRKSYLETRKAAMELLEFAWRMEHAKIPNLAAIFKFVAFLWLLGEDTFDDLLNNYTGSTKPELERISNYFNVSWTKLYNNLATKNTIVRTNAEILQRFKIRQPISDLDEWSFYLEALPFSLAKPYLEFDTDSEKWDKDRKSYFEIRDEATKYLAFAWEKANDKKGLSAIRSIRHYVGWLWLLGCDNFDDLFDNYKYYGKPQLERISDYFNVSWKELDDGVREND